MSVIITVATTGPVATKNDNPSLPTSPEEISKEVAQAYAEGAAVAHLHFRDAAGRPTADLAVAERTVELARALDLSIASVDEAAQALQLPETPRS